MQQSLQRTREGLSFKAPKTRGSKRTLHIPPAVNALLAWHREQHGATRREFGSEVTEHDLVCAWEDGRPFRPHYVTLAFTRLRERLGLPVRFHDLRHTQVSVLIALGEHIKVISTRLGHSSVQITMDRYGHLLPGMDEAAAHRLDPLLQSATAPMSASVNELAPDHFEAAEDGPAE